MNRPVGILLFAVCVVLFSLHSVFGQCVIDSVPLKKISLLEAKTRLARKYVNRQNEEKFPLAAKLGEKGWFSVNLRPYCNINLFSKEGRTCPPQFHQMKLGRQHFYGVPFDIISPQDNDNKTALGLPSTRFLTRELPASATVPVGKKAGVLYFLHTTYFTSRGGKQYYIINYDDGTQARIRFVGTVHSGDWYHQSTRVYTDDVHYVLVPSSKGATLHHRNMHIFQWKNPSPEKGIKSITFQSDPKAEMAIFVVGVTGHP